MSAKKASRLVYSTDGGRRCPTCGWPVNDCRCSGRLDQPVPTSGVMTVRLRIERAGRRGKTVTVVDGLPRNKVFLKDLAAELKKACGSGGAVREDRVEVQGDQRATIRSTLEGKGWKVKGE